MFDVGGKGDSKNYKEQLTITMNIFVGSTNPVKINAVTIAASEQWPECQVTGLSVPSGVNDQPRTDDETYQGAFNRAKAVLELGLTSIEESRAGRDLSRLVLGVGLEGGVFEKENGELWSTVWAVVVDESGFSTSANGARFRVPEIVAEKIRLGEEMGLVISAIVGQDDVRKKQGMIGIITQNFVDRTEEYSGIAKLALGLWYGRKWENGSVSM